jgi:hypothetical protein
MTAVIPAQPSRRVVLAAVNREGDISRYHPSHTTGHTGPYHGGSAD